jgi:hypothetical protein
MSDHPFNSPINPGFILFELGAMFGGALAMFVTFPSDGNLDKFVNHSIGYFGAGGAFFILGLACFLLTLDQIKQANTPLKPWVKLDETDYRSLEKRARYLAEHAPRYSGDGSEFYGTGGAKFPASVIVECEQGQHWIGAVQVMVSVGFDRDGNQYGPVYHWSQATF